MKMKKVKWVSVPMRRCEMTVPRILRSGLPMMNERELGAAVLALVGLALVCADAAAAATVIR